MRKNYKLAYFICLICISSFLRAQQNDFWSSIDEAKIGISKLERKVQPKKYKTFKLDLERLKNDLNFDQFFNSAAVKSSFVISFPDENGIITDFEITEASVMHPELAKKYPNNKSFKGFSVKNASKQIRFSINEIGLSAIIMDTETGHTLIDPIGNDLRYYKVYAENSYEATEEDLKDVSGNYWSVAGDLSFMFPMLEMSGENHFKFI